VVQLVGFDAAVAHADDAPGPRGDELALVDGQADAVEGANEVRPQVVVLDQVDDLNDGRHGFSGRLRRSAGRYAASGESCRSSAPVLRAAVVGGKPPAPPRLRSLPPRSSLPSASLPFLSRPSTSTLRMT